MSSNDIIANPFRFSGGFGIATDESDLLFMGARAYDSAQGRFISRDPIGVQGGSNIYSFSLNDPVNKADPSGHIAIWVFAATVGAATEVTAYVASGYISGEEVTLGGVVGSALSGGIDGIILITPGIGAPVKVAISAGSAAIGNVIQQEIDIYNGDQLGGFNSEQFIEAVALETFSSSLMFGIDIDLPKIPGITGGTNSWSAITKLTFTKIINGTIEHVSLKTILKGVGVTIAETLFDEIIEGAVNILRSKDPNDIVGPRGYGYEHFVSASQASTYTVHFENQSIATAPAQHIVITQQLDSDLDPRSFRLTGFGFDNQRYDLAGDKSFYSHASI